MRKRVGIILGAAMVAVLGGWAWRDHTRLPGPPDPVYSGHPLRQWMDGSFSPGFPNSLDSNAVPFLIQGLKEQDGPLLRAYYDIDWPDFIQRRLPNPEPAMIVRFNSCQYLNQLGAGARPAIPELIHVLAGDENQPTRAIAAGALKNIANRDDKLAVEALIAATKDKDPTVAMRAGDALSHIDPEAASKAGITNAPAGASSAAPPGPAR